MVGQHRNEQVRADTGVRAMPDWAQAELRLQLPEGVFKVSQSPVRAENLFCIPIGVAGSEHTGPGSSIRQIGLVLPLEANRRCSIIGSLNPDPILAGDATTAISKPQLWLRMTRRCPLPVTVFMREWRASCPRGAFRRSVFCRTYYHGRRAAHSQRYRPQNRRNPQRSLPDDGEGECTGNLRDAQHDQLEPRCDRRVRGRTNQRTWPN